MWLLLASNSVLGTISVGKDIDFVCLVSGFKGTCFFPVGTCFMGQLTSCKNSENSQIKSQDNQFSKISYVWQSWPLKLYPLLKCYQNKCNNMKTSVKWKHTLRFLWQTFTSSTSRETEFCSFSELWHGLSVKNQSIIGQILNSDMLSKCNIEMCTILYTLYDFQTKEAFLNAAHVFNYQNNLYIV